MASIIFLYLLFLFNSSSHSYCEEVGGVEVVNEGVLAFWFIGGGKGVTPRKTRAPGAEGGGLPALFCVCSCSLSGL